MKIVITGGAGFIGSNLAQTLQHHDRVSEIRVIDDLSTGLEENLWSVDVRFFEGSILDSRLLDEALDGADAVVHLAALPSVPRSVKDPLAAHHVNATGTLQVLEAARRAGHPHVVAASSSSVYGANAALPEKEELRAAPSSPYAVSKLATESYLAAYHCSYGVPVLPFRFFNVYGPGQRAVHDYAAVIPRWISAALTGQPLLVHGTGEQTRDFTYVGTVCRVLMDALLNRTVHPAPVNLAFNTPVSLLDLASEIEREMGSTLRVVFAQPRPGDVPHSSADSSRLRCLFPAVTPVPLAQGLRQTIDWARATVC